jgi:TrpR-related protein YerC/YecD
MGKPKGEVKEKSYYKDIYFLYDALSTLKNIDEVKMFMKDILTRSELRMLKRRWHIANLLMSGLDIREVADQSKTSTQTVSRVKKILEEGHGGLSTAVQRVSQKASKQQKEYKSNHEQKNSSKFVKGWFT